MIDVNYEPIGLGNVSIFKLTRKDVEKLPEMIANVLENEKVFSSRILEVIDNKVIHSYEDIIIFMVTYKTKKEIDIFDQKKTLSLYDDKFPNELYIRRSYRGSTYLIATLKGNKLRLDENIDIERKDGYYKVGLRYDKYRDIYKKLEIINDGEIVPIEDDNLIKLIINATEELLNNDKLLIVKDI